MAGLGQSQAEILGVGGELVREGSGPGWEGDQQGICFFFTGRMRGWQTTADDSEWGWEKPSPGGPSLRG